MELIETLQEHCQKKCSIKSILKIFVTASKEETTCPLNILTNDKAMALMLNWLAWHGKSKEQIELRIAEPEKQTVYAVGIRLRKNVIYVRYVHNTPELVNKRLHHWYYTSTYQTLSVQDIKDSVENADILNMLGTVCNTSEEISDFDWEL